MLLRKKALNSILLVTAIFTSLLLLAMITVVIFAPWYTTLEFQSTSMAWDCHIVIKRNAMYGYRTCRCEDPKIGQFANPDWCEDGYYDWRNCQNCDNIGCACQMELRLWNSTIGFVFIAWGLSLVVSLMLILQLSDTIKGFQTSYTQTAINAVNFIIPIFLITAYFLFLDLPSALRKDYGTRCDNYGICNSFIGSANTSISWETYYYPSTESWGPEYGWWLLLASIIISGVNIIITLTYSVTLWKLIGTFY